MDSHFQRSRSLAMDEDSDDQLLYSSSPSPTARLQARRRQPSGLPLGATSSPSTSLPTTTMISGRPSPLPTPTKSVPCLHNLNPPAPTSPPTPAPSPKPHQSIPNWVTAAEDEDAFLRETRSHFSGLGVSAKQFFLAEVLNLCDNQQLSFVNGFVSLRLKKDPFAILPNELCLRILSFIDDPKTLARSSQVSRRWYELLNDDLTWKLLCDKHSYRRMSEDTRENIEFFSFTSSFIQCGQSSSRHSLKGIDTPERSFTEPTGQLLSHDFQGLRPRKRRVRTTTYRSHFKRKYMIEAAWRKSGSVTSKNITSDQAVVTGLHVTPKYIVVALENAKIHVFSLNGEFQRTLRGHIMGVWAMVPWGDILVSGGCDRDVRVWNMTTGKSLRKLHGHTSTVRCLKMANAWTAISGSRDTTLRIWDLEAGVCRNVLIGHQASVRCLAIHGDLVVSGSYDTTARIWDIKTGRPLYVLAGHFSQIYAVAFDGKQIATGSLDTSVRLWNPMNGQCTGILQGHTSLVGLLQMRGDTLVTGGSDGSIRVWSLAQQKAFHRLVAHDNSITSLEFDNSRIISGGSDGRVKVWDLKTGQLIRELGQVSDAVWRVSLQEEKAVIAATKNSRTFIEVWSFSPPDDQEEEGSLVPSHASTPESKPNDRAGELASISSTSRSPVNPMHASEETRELSMTDIR